MLTSNTNITNTLLPTSITGITNGTGGLAMFGGAGLVGYIIGFAMKKILKWLLIGRIFWIPISKICV
jgi:uncharacterized membrane protein (Fun14 family)